MSRRARTFAPDPAFAAPGQRERPRHLRQAPPPILKAWWASWADKLDWIEPYGDGLRVRGRRTPGGSSAASSTPASTASTATTPTSGAIVFEGEPGDVAHNHLRRAEGSRSPASPTPSKSLGRRSKGDRVLAYLPMIPELAMTMLACARIGATHTVVFGGFSADAVHESANDAGAKVIVTADGGWRRGKAGAADGHRPHEALEKGCPTVENTMVVLRPRGPGRPARRRQACTSAGRASSPSSHAECPCEPMDSEDPLYILYTSGSTGKPQGHRPTPPAATSLA